MPPLLLFESAASRGPIAVGKPLPLGRRAGWKPSSVNLALAAVDHFNRFLGLGAANVRREPRAQAAPRALSEDQQRVLLRAAESSRPRDRAILTLLLYTALRLGERRGGAAGGAALFVGPQGRRLTARSVDRAVRAVAARAGLDLSAHVLRHYVDG